MSRWETAAGALGGLLVLAVVVFFFWQAFATPNRPPALRVTVAEIAPSGAGYRVHVLVRNSGGATAAGVGIEGTLLADGQAVETSETTLDYVPEDSAGEATLLFSQDPQEYELQVRPVAYEEP